VLFKLRFTGRFKLVSTLLYVAMGWLAMLAIRPLMAALDDWSLRWLVAGGIAYTAGTVFYHRPSLPYSHAVWHLFVITGSACHYLAVLPLMVLPR
jgi:hemolysin III